MVKRAPEASPSVTFSHLRPNIAYILFHDSDHVFYISTVSVIYVSPITLYQVHALPFFSLIKKDMETSIGFTET